ncbi:MAG: hypothetical protein KatS3mg068_2230 [Candidatus Sericytochromatia bacterium]|nr:MAG: hypothetical protein KatS3mg068_2230 [Candidatus Sericytochromatia bacterium]
MKKLIECVPNFSEGRNKQIIEQIINEIKSVEKVKLLDFDSGKATNRTVVTFVGEPDNVIEAAFLSIKKASELIDMSKHSGEHPRMGATDVCPLIPISNISIEEAVEYSHKLAKRVADELNIPVYLYEYSASIEERKNLANIRKGEYEGLEEKLKDPKWKPDYGKAEFNKKSGATVIGVRDFLIAYNINLNTKSVRKANSIAFDIREKGRIKRIGNPITGEIVKDEFGNPVWEPGSLKKVKAIGWFIDEYNIAQVSMNITDYKTTPLHIAFEETVNKANQRGIRVTGSEIVGMVPLEVILDAGKYFLKKQGRSLGVTEEELIHIAVKSLGLDELYKFEPEKKIIEYAIREKENKLVDLSLKKFADKVASESPAPGGGSVSAYLGTLGVSLATMVANISANKRGWEDLVETFSFWAEKGQEVKEELMKLVDEDTKAFNSVLDAYKNKNEIEIENANKNAMLVPFKIMKTCLKSFEILKEMVKSGNQNSISDVGVGVLCIRSSIIGAYLNVKINANSVKDKSFVENILSEAEEIKKKVNDFEKEILNIVYKAIDNSK